MPSSKELSPLHPRGMKAIALARKGFRIFPLVPGEKTPALKSWPQLATADETTILRWWNQRDYNIGIATGPASHLRLIDGHNGATGLAQTSYALIVIDYDCKPGQRGAAALWLHTFLGYVDTLTAKTPNGIHKYFWVSVDVLIPNSQSRIAENVDVRGVKGYVVGSGSTVGGIDYVWDGEETEPAELPQFFLALAMRSGTNVPIHEQPRRLAVGELDRPDAIERVKRYLINDAPEAIEGSHGDRTTFAVAARCKDLGVSEDVCLKLMLDHWNEEKASPPWAYDALRTKVRNAYQYGANAPGSANVANEFSLVPGVGNVGLGHAKDPTDRHKVMRWAWLDGAADSALSFRQDFLIEDLLIQHELSVLFGQSGTGKSFVTLDIAYSVASGFPWNGHKVKQGLVVYVAAEGQAGIGKRLAALRQQRPAPGAKIALAVIREPIDLVITTGEDNDANRMMRAIREIEAEHGQPVALIVFDTLSRVLVGADENSNVDMGKFIKTVGLIMQATGAHILMVHHAGKDIMRGARGWSGIKAALDTEMEIHEHRLTITKQREIDELPPCRFRLRQVAIGQGPDGRDVTSCVVEWGTAAEPIMEEKTPIENETMAAVLKVLETGKNFVTTEKVLRASGVDLDQLDAEERDRQMDTMGKRLRQLEKDGHLIKGAVRGVFKLA